MSDILTKPVDSTPAEFYVGIPYTPVVTEAEMAISPDDATNAPETEFNENQKAQDEQEWFLDIINQIKDFLQGDVNDELGRLKPTDYSWQETLSILMDILLESKENKLLQKSLNSIPKGCVTTDEQGGIRIEWSMNEGDVFLIVPSTEEGRSYIYHEDGEEYGTKEPATGSSLAKWLRIFSKDER